MVIPSNAKTIWKWFCVNTDYSEIGIAAIMGNLYAESALEPVRRQGDFTADRSKSKSYTADVDGGVKPLSVFAGDQYGYGLAQWTYPARKEKLLQYAWKRGTSVGDLFTQLGFIVLELSEDYKAVSDKLKTTGDLQAASNAVLMYYENPADKSAGVQAQRAKYGHEFYQAFKNMEPAPSKPTNEEIIKVLSWLMEEFKNGF